MLDQFKAMGALAGLLKNKERMQAVADRVKRNLDDARVVGQAGGGVVRVTMTGRATVISVEIATALLAGAGSDPAAHEQLQSLLVEASNDAFHLAQTVMRKEASAAARELGLPEIPGLESMLG